MLLLAQAALCEMSCGRIRRTFVIPAKAEADRLATPLSVVADQT